MLPLCHLCLLYLQIYKFIFQIEIEEESNFPIPNGLQAESAVIAVDSIFIYDGNCDGKSPFFAYFQVHEVYFHLFRGSLQKYTNSI